MTEANIIERCLQNDRQAQKALYDRYADSLLGVAMRYMKDPMLAEDVLVEAMYTILTKIEQYKQSGSFYGWMKRILVNQALMKLRKASLDMKDINKVDHALKENSNSALEDLYEADILELMAKLPTGYRTVINLYLIEGYKHREIAEILGISTNTSKSQLALAKKYMIKLLENQKYPNTQKNPK